jgi:hypothetical protein
MDNECARCHRKMAFDNLYYWEPPDTPGCPPVVCGKCYDALRGEEIKTGAKVIAQPRQSEPLIDSTRLDLVRCTLCGTNGPREARENCSSGYEKIRANTHADGSAASADTVRRDVGKGDS